MAGLVPANYRPANGMKSRMASILLKSISTHSWVNVLGPIADRMRPSDHCKGAKDLR